MLALHISLGIIIAFLVITVSPVILWVFIFLVSLISIIIRDTFKWIRRKTRYWFV